LLTTELHTGEHCHFPYLKDFFGDGTAASYNGMYLLTGDLNDYNATLGYKAVQNGWNTDASITVGGNTQTYNVDNSHNRSAIKDANRANVYKIAQSFQTWRNIFQSCCR
jgi:iron complex outermembrane receptor protein